MTCVSFGSACFIANPKYIYLMTVARCLVGFGHGFCYLTVVVHASEIVTQKLRGMTVATLNFCVISSIMMSGSFTMANNVEEQGFNSMKWMGITGVIFSAMGIIFTFIFTREAPVTLIRQKKFDQAVSLMIQLRSESSETWSIRNEYNELKAMVEEDEQTNERILDDRNMRPLMLITLLKVGSVLAFNFGLNMIRLKTMFVDAEGVNYTVMILMNIRMMAALVTLFTIDSKGRRPHFLLSFVGSSVILIALGFVVAVDSSMNWLLGALQICYEIVGGFGIGMISDVYASEAFNIVKKPKSILFTTAVEYLLHAVIIIATFNVTSSKTYDWIFLIGSGLLIMVVTVFLFKELPETAKMSIRQTRTEFLKVGEIVFSGSKMPTQNITFN